MYRKILEGNGNNAAYFLYMRRSNKGQVCFGTHHHLYIFCIRDSPFLMPERLILLSYFFYMVSGRSFHLISDRSLPLVSKSKQGPKNFNMIN